MELRGLHNRQCIFLLVYVERVQLIKLHCFYTYTKLVRLVERLLCARN